MAKKSNWTPGILWTTIAGLIPLLVTFLNSGVESGLWPASYSLAVVVVLNALGRLIEIFQNEPGTPVDGGDVPRDVQQATYQPRPPKRNAISRLLLGG